MPSGNFEVLGVKVAYRATSSGELELKAGIKTSGEIHLESAVDVSGEYVEDYLLHETSPATSELFLSGEIDLLQMAFESA